MTDDRHGLMRRNVHLDTAGPFSVIGKAFGPGSGFTRRIPTSFSCLPSISSLRRSRSSPVYRRQTQILLIGFLLPLICNALHNFGVSPIPHHDVSPAILSLSGAMVAWGLFRYRLFDIAPVARTTVLEGIDDGVIVLDVQKRVVK